MMPMPPVDNEAYYTPSWCVDRLFELWTFWDQVGLPSDRVPRWLESCAGEGHLYRAVRPRYPRIAWTLVEKDREAYKRLVQREGWVLAWSDYCCDIMDWEGKYDVVMSNPPYSKAQLIIEKCLELAPVVVMLLRMDFIGSKQRHRFLRQHTPDIYVLPDRVQFINATGSGLTWYSAWFVFSPTSSGRYHILNTTPLEVRKVCKNQ